MNLAVLLNFVIVVVVVGGVVYLLNLAPIDVTIKKIGTWLIIIVAIVLALKWLVGVVH